MKDLPKWWCQFCRVNVPYNKQSISQHQSSKIHQKNKNSQIYHQKKINKQSTVKPKVAPRLNQEQKKVLIQRSDQMMKSAMHRINSIMIQKTKGQYGAPIDYAGMQPLKPQSSSNEKQQFRLWQIIENERKGKVQYRNSITGTVMEQKPVGLILTEEQRQKVRRIEQKFKSVERPDSEQEVCVGQWQQVQDHQNFFIKNKIEGLVQSNFQAPLSQSSSSEDDDFYVQKISAVLLANSKIGLSLSQAKVVKQGMKEAYDCVLMEKKKQEDLQNCTGITKKKNKGTVIQI